MAFGCAGRWRALGPVESEAIRRLVERRHYGEPGARQSADISLHKQKESAPKLVNEPQVEASEMEFSAKEEELFRRLLKVRNLPMAQDEQPEPEGIAMQNEMLR